LKFNSFVIALCQRRSNKNESVQYDNVGFLLEQLRISMLGELLDDEFNRFKKCYSLTFA